MASQTYGNPSQGAGGQFRQRRAPLATSPPPLITDRPPRSPPTDPNSNDIVRLPMSVPHYASTPSNA